MFISILVESLDFVYRNVGQSLELEQFLETWIPVKKDFEAPFHQYSSNLQR